MIREPATGPVPSLLKIGREASTIGPIPVLSQPSHSCRTPARLAGNRQPDRRTDITACLGIFASQIRTHFFPEKPPFRIKKLDHIQLQPFQRLGIDFLGRKFRIGAAAKS